VLIGHASVSTQLDWCRAGDVGRAIFTHCGSGVVRAVPSQVDAVSDRWDARVALKQASLMTVLPSGSDVFILIQGEPCLRFPSMKSEPSNL
jgi:hypothetical protein